MTATLISMSVAAIILAAGASSRLGQPKQLLELHGETLLGRAIRLAAEAGASPILTVLGAHFEIIAASIRSFDSVPIFNEHWQQGISSSIHAGLRSLDVLAPLTAGALLMNCDQPQLTASHLRILIDAFNAHRQPTVIASCYAGVHGVPAVFPRAVFPRLLALSGDKGARLLLAHPPCPLIAYDLPGGENDIDLPADLVQLQ